MIKILNKKSTAGKTKIFMRLICLGFIFASVHANAQIGVPPSNIEVTLIAGTGQHDGTSDVILVALHTTTDGWSPWHYIVGLNREQALTLTFKQYGKPDALAVYAGNKDGVRLNILVDVKDTRYLADPPNKWVKHDIAFFELNEVFVRQEFCCSSIEWNPDRNKNEGKDCKEKVPGKGSICGANRGHVMPCSGNDTEPNSAGTTRCGEDLS